MGTTLEAELELAAKDCEVMADWLASPLAGVREKGAAEMRSRAARIRQRAAWVRELGRNADAMEATFPDDVTSKVYVALYRRLTGPIPAAETAPTERKP